MRHFVKPLSYVRYGDNFIMILEDKPSAMLAQQKCMEFLSEKLQLSTNTRNDIIAKTKRGIWFLGARIFSGGTAITGKTWQRVITKLESENISGYSGLTSKVGCQKQRKVFHYQTVSVIIDGTMRVNT